MRKWTTHPVSRLLALTLLVLSAMATPAFAAKLLTIDQMEDLLARLHGKSDSKVASELDEVQLTERATPSRLARWESQFPGPRVHEEMVRLADLSAFQKPPIDDLLRDPEPDADTQVQILTLAAHHVRATIAHLPDFYASRNTTHYESLISQRMDYAVGGPGNSGISTALSALNLKQAGVDSTVEIEDLHSAGQSSTTVTYRDGHEILGEETDKQKKEPNYGLTTDNEFGPILAVIVGDALQSKVSWLRWEQGPAEPEAVFQFSVPEDKSHFRVTITEGGKAVALTPAYHGEIEVDPGTGEILRLSEIADIAPPRQAMRAAIMVEFGPITIGNRTYICPLRGVAFSRFPIPNAAPGMPAPMQTRLNDVAFTNYHEFRSEMRILANNGDADAPAPNTPAANPPAPAEATASPSPNATAAPAAASTQSPATAPSANPSQASASSPSAAPAPQPEVAVSSGPTPNPPAATPSPATPSTATAGPATAGPATPAPAEAKSSDLTASTVFHTSTQLVLVDVVATNHDRPVEGLSRDQFHVFEDGHEVPIASFNAVAPAPGDQVSEPPALPPHTYSNRPTYPDTGSVNVLLLDALNTPATDQEQVRRTMIDYLGSVRPGTPLAVFTLSSQLRMAAGFTTDSARLLKIFQSEKTTSHSSSAVGSTRGQDASSDITHAASSVAVSNDPGTRRLVTQIMQFAADMKTYDTDQRERITLEALRQLAAYLAGVPGRKNVIWFSGSFPVSLSPIPGSQNASVDQRDYAEDMEQTSNQLTAARVSVYPVDARGILIAPTSDASYTPPPTFGGTSSSRTIANDNQSFTVDSSQERGTMNSIASETGGRVYSAGNDLKKAVEKIIAADSSYYALSYTPPEHKDSARGDRFHSIEVKVDGGYQLSYRRGYYQDQPAAALPGSGNAPAPMLAAAMPGAPPSTQILFQARVLPQNGTQPGASHEDSASASAAGAPLADSPAGDSSGSASSPPADSITPGEQRYSVELFVDPRGLTFSQSADATRHTQLQCALVAFDANGKQLNSASRTLAMTFSPQQWDSLQAAGVTFPVHLALNLPAGEIALRIVVYDAASTHTGSLEIPVDVPPSAAP